MFIYIVQRFFISLFILLLGSFLTFIMISGFVDPTSQLKMKQPPAPKYVIVHEEHRMHMDQPVVKRYFIWLNGIFHGDLGPSVVNGVNIGNRLLLAFETSIRLMLFASILSFVFALVIGSYSAYKLNSKFDISVNTINFIIYSLPVLILASLIKIAAIYINQNIGFDIFSTLGESTPGGTGGFLSNIADIFAHSFIPTLVLMLINLSSWIRFQRVSTINVLKHDYITLARSKGISTYRLFTKHIFRNSIGNLISVVALDIGFLISNTIIIESIFGWFGLGTFFINAIHTSDMYEIVDWLLLSGFIIIIFNLIADILYTLLDPRLKYSTN